MKTAGAPRHLRTFLVNEVTITPPRDWLRRVRRAGRQFFRARLGCGRRIPRYELTACLKIQDAARYLLEWIKFHQIVGFGPEAPSFPKSHEHCVAHHRNEACWVAFLDDDEFLFRSKGIDVRKILRR